MPRTHPLESPPVRPFVPFQVKPLGDPITSATISIYRAVSKELLPTPSKSHYLFNTRDLAKIIQGMMQVRVVTGVGVCGGAC